MTLKNKIANNVSLLFSFFLGFILLTVYLLYAKYRSDEFRQIMNDRISTISSLVSANPNHNNGLIDVNLIEDTPTYSLQQEQIFIFDQNLKLIYSNIKNKQIAWNENDIKFLKTNKDLYRVDGDIDIFGRASHGNYYLIQAIDFTGDGKLLYLRNVLLVAFFVASMMVWLLSFQFAGKMLEPLNDLQKRITNISVNNLNEKLPVTQNKDEINLLAKVFNTMLERINYSFSAQKEFTASASHEIKTPLARISYQLENLTGVAKDDESVKYVKGIRKEVFQLSDTIDSLFLLSRIESHENTSFEEVRMDEVVFDTFEMTKKNYSNFEIDFMICEKSMDGDLTIKGVKLLLEIVFLNLFKNARLYSEDKKAKVELCERPNELIVVVSNKGKLIPEEERQKIFEAFKRGSNSQNEKGSGLGLRISKRIMDYHNAEFSYNSDSGINNFVLKFST